MLAEGFKVYLMGLDSDLSTFTIDSNGEVAIDGTTIKQPDSENSGWTTLYVYGHNPVFEEEGDTVQTNGGVMIDHSKDRLKLTLKVALEKVNSGLTFEDTLKDLRAKKTIFFYGGDLLAYTDWIHASTTVIPVVLKRSIEYLYDYGYSQHTIELSKRFLE